MINRCRLPLQRRKYYWPKSDHPSRGVSSFPFQAPLRPLLPKLIRSYEVLLITLQCHRLRILTRTLFFVLRDGKIMGDINRPRNTVVVGQKVTGNAKMPNLVLPVKGKSGQDVTGAHILGNAKVLEDTFVLANSDGVNDGKVTGVHVEGDYEGAGDVTVCVNTDLDVAEKMQNMLSKKYNLR